MEINNYNSFKKIKVQYDYWSSCIMGENKTYRHLEIQHKNVQIVNFEDGSDVDKKKSKYEGLKMLNIIYSVDYIS